MMVRLFIIVAALPVLVLAFFHRLTREIGSAFWFAWNDCVIEIDAMKRSWHRKSFEVEGE